MTPRSIFVDTGPLVARYLKNDSLHDLAKTCWLAVERDFDTFALSSLVLAETMNMIGRRATPAFAAARGANILRSQILETWRPGREDEEQALVYMEKFSDQRVSFTDCVSFALVKARGVDHVFTFDRHFDLLGFERYPLN